MFSKKTLSILIIAVLIGIITRTWRITTLPFPPNGDELAFGYYGWSLLHFGTDEYGNKFPFYFSSIGDYKYPVLAYLDIIPALFFGLSEITVRFWSVISGVLLIPLIYFLSKLIFKSETAALASAFLTSLSPWSISLSRYGYENNVAVTLTTIAILLLLLATKSKSNKKLLIFSFIFFLISSFTYGTQKVFIPLFLLFLTVFSFTKDNLFQKLRKIIFLLFLTLTIISAISLIPWQSRGRASGVLYNGLSPQDANQLEELKVEAGISSIHVPVKITQLFHNKVRIAALSFTERYLNHFSPSFLFFNGESAIERIPLSGQLLLIEIFLLPFGLMKLFSKSANTSTLSLLWLTAAPVASALTLGEPHINRASIMIPPLALLSGFGFSELILIPKNLLLKKGILVFLILGILFSSLFILNQLFVHKSVHQPWIREQVNKEMVKDISTLKDIYKAVVISKTDNEYMFYLFYNLISPKEFLANADITKESKEDQWKRVNRLYNIYFKMPFDCPKSGKLNVLYVCTGPNIPQNSKVLKVIRYLDHVPAYSYITFYPISQMKKLDQLPQGLDYMVDLESSPYSPDGIIPDKDDRFW